VRNKAYSLEDLRIVGLNSETSMQEEVTFTLEGFRKKQNQNRYRVKEAIKRTSAECRE
jgi:hypothetical protein